MNDVCKILCHQAKGFAKSFGKQCEVTVHDEDLKIIYIENGELSGRQVGEYMDETVFNYLDDEAKKNDNIVVRITRKEDNQLQKSTTFMYYDPEGIFQGMFCMTYDLTEMNRARNLLDTIMNVKPFEDDEDTVSNMSVSDYMQRTITEIIKDVGKPSTLGSREIRMRIISQLDEKGVFQLKDSVPRVCDLLKISQATLYNYLREIRTKNTSLISVI